MRKSTFLKNACRWLSMIVLLPPLWLVQESFSQCNNADFETGTWTGWSGWTGYHPTSGIAPACCPVAGFVAGRFAIVSGAGTDPCGNFPIVATGGSFSLKLGNNSVGAESDRVKMSFTVTASTTSFTYQYAVVLEDPGHPPSDQPYFEIKMTDGGGADIPCSYYYVAAGQGIPGFQNSGSCFGVVYKPWTTVNIDLSPYIGQSVTIQFTVSDCSQTGHYGYAYVDASCVPFSITQYDSLCNPGNPIYIFAPAGAAAYSWTPGGQTTQYIQVSTAGNYCVQMTSVQGCITNLCHQVSLYPGITADFNIATQCSLIVDFTDATTGGAATSWSWDFGDGSPLDFSQSPSHTFPTNNPYNVELNVQTTNGCKDSIVKSVTPLFNPTAAFTATTECLNSPTYFSDFSTGGVISQWQWDFGDPASGANNTSAIKNPSHTFTSAGTFIVQLIVNNSIGCTDTVFQSVTVNPLPSVNFQAPGVCFGDTSWFTNLSTVSTGVIAGWTWNFGDPMSGASNSSALQNPGHVFTAPLNFNVTLTAITDSGCQGTKTNSIQVYALPFANFAAQNKCLVNAVNFVDQSTGGAVTWSWDFGDFSTDAVKNPSHLYSSPGTFTVELAVTNTNGCIDSVSKTVTIFPMPVAGFTTDSVCRYLPTQFYDTSTVSSGSIMGWKWLFGDASPVSTIPNPSHVYPDGITYYATLIVSSDENCNDTVMNPVVVHPLPVPDFSAPSVCFRDSMVFSNLSTIPSPGTIVAWLWNFGDNTTSVLQNPAHTYPADGQYTVQLTASSDKFCVDSVAKNVTVFPLPVAFFTTNNVCVYDSALFTDASSVTSGNITIWNWDFGDSQASTVISPYHKYSTAGTYTVTLNITTNFNCKDDTSAIITIHPQPVADFSVQPVCFNDTSRFSDSSTVTTGAIVSWSWSFGDANTSTLQSPTHRYGNDAIYTVILTVVTDSGCINSYAGPAVVWPLPVAYFSVAPVCLNEVSVFNESSYPADSIIAWDWDFGDGTGTGSVSDPAYTYATDNLYYVRLIVTDNKSCIDTLIDTARVWPVPYVDFTGDNLSGCEPLPVNFSNFSYVKNGIINNIYWDFGDGNTSDLFLPANTYINDGIYDVMLIITSDHGCTDSVEKFYYIEVYPQPFAEFNFQPLPTTILWPNVTFTDISIIPSYWHWEFGDGDTDNVQNPMHTYRDTGTYFATLIVTTDRGCKDTIRHAVIINPDFAFFIPNTFTPNHDGFNDYFSGNGLGILTYQMFIYDRWGDLIYKTDDFNKPWDGKANNGAAMAQQDTYVYVVYITDVLKNKHRFIGHVNLIK